MASESGAVPRFMSRDPSDGIGSILSDVAEAGANYIVDDGPVSPTESSSAVPVQGQNGPMIHVISSDPAHNLDIDLSTATSAEPAIVVAREENHKLVDAYPSWQKACEKFGCTAAELENAARRRLQINYGTEAWYNVMILRKDGAIIYDRKAEMKKLEKEALELLERRKSGNACCTIL